jgi:hypothetical protein
MDISQAQARIRPRSPWEAIDLGLVLAREWFFDLWIAWLMLALPIAIFAHLLFYDTLWLAAMLLWWFKPLYEQPLLYIVSRRLFGESISRGELRRRLLSIIRPGLLANLSWRRLNLSRSFDNPVAMLEGQSGKARKERLQLLHRQQSISNWLTIIGAHVEGIFYLSSIALILLWIPEQLDWLEVDDFLFDSSDNHVLAEWLLNAGYLLALSIVAPFYVSAGFSLYIYTRVRLEAWEIEIAFRAIRHRLDGLKSKTTVWLAPALLCSLLLGAPDSALAQSDVNTPVAHTPATSQQMIENILRHEDFGSTRTQTRWRWRNADEQDDFSDWDFGRWLTDFLHWLAGERETRDGNGSRLNIAQLIEILLWGVAAIVLAMLLRFLWPYLQRLLWRSGEGPGTTQAPTFAISILSDKLALHELPNDIVSEVARLRQAGQTRAAISLLYRGALRSLIQMGQLDIPASATEADCMTHVARSRNADEADYFARLTRAWLAIAYAHRHPSEQLVDELADAWPAYFEVQS